MTKIFTKIVAKFLSLFLLLVAPEKASVRKLAHLEPGDVAEILPATEPITSAKNLSAVFSYKDRRVKEMVWEIKYRKNSALVEKVGVLLYEKIKSCAEKLEADSQSIILTPIPASERRRRERGFNQCEIICEAIMEAAAKEAACGKNSPEF